MTEILAQSFERFAADEGLTLLPYENDEDWLSEIAAFYTWNELPLDAARRNGQPMILDIHIIDRQGLNAFAGTFDGEDVIGLYSGVVRILRSTARTLVSRGLIIPDIGTSGILTTPRSVDGRPADVLRGHITPDDTPLEDPLRDKLACKIAHLAIQFIMQHELAHICNGHTDWLNSEGALGLVVEIDDRNLKAEKGIERETLEWDADCAAIGEIIAIALQPLVSIVGGRRAWLIPKKNAIGSGSDAIVAVYAALFICSGYFAALESADLEDHAPRSHPHPVMRMYSGADLITHLIAFRGGMSKREVDALVDPMVADAVGLSWKQMFAASQNKWGVPSEEFLAARLKLYHDTWARLHPHLEPFKRGGANAPAVQARHPAFPDNDVLG